MEGTSIYYSSRLLYNKPYESIITPIGDIYEMKAYKPRANRRSRLGKGIYTRQEYRLIVYADNEYEAYITLLDYGYTDIVIINP
jgi:hypothetical protein